MRGRTQLVLDLGPQAPLLCITLVFCEQSLSVSLTTACLLPGPSPTVLSTVHPRLTQQALGLLGLFFQEAHAGGSVRSQILRLRILGYFSSSEYLLSTCCVPKGEQKDCQGLRHTLAFVGSTRC